MIISLLSVIVMIVQADPVLYPIYQTDFHSKCNSIDAVAGQTLQVTYSPSFPSIPKVIISWSKNSVSASSTKAFAKFDSTDTSSFNYICDFTPGKFNFIHIQWLAFLDDNLFVINDGYTTTFPVTIVFAKLFSSTPSVAVFLQGFQNTALSGSVHFNIKTVNPTTSSVQIDKTGFGIIPSLQVYYQLIYGDSSFFQSVQKGGSIGSLIPPFTPTPQMKVIFGGLLEVDYDNVNVLVSQTLDLSTPGTVTYLRQAPGATLSSTTYIITYFYYMPSCPLYCTSCDTLGYPYCDACLPGTLRTLANNCQTCPINSYASDNFYTCQQCMNICDTCTTGTTCTVCLSGSLRTGLPLCNQCPAQMFIQSSNLVCQQCLSYCDNCQYEPTRCIACQAGSGRINPPLCTQCQLTSQYIPQGSLNCQTCSIYCETCANSPNYCQACLSGSQRLYPPTCLTCPNQMFAISTVANCQACATYCNNCQITSTTCSSCQLSTYRINPPNCTTCPPNWYSVASQDNCQQCKPYCNECVTSADTCVACNGLYRMNSPNCNQCSMANYYINASLNDCQVCESYCNGCQASSTNCISCWPFTFSQLSSNCVSCPINSFILPSSLCSLDLVSQVCSNAYNRDPMCNCLDGFYNSETSISCLKCSSICQTCISSATNCVICNSAVQLQNPPNCNQCISGQFILYGSCHECSNICSTCAQSRTHCLTCSQPFINPPLCSCPDGFYNECKQLCSAQCQTCKNSGANCLTCSGNRINPPLCDCPDGSAQSTGICEECSLAQPSARFTDDLTSIEIIFINKLRPILNCDTLFICNTLIEIGTNPNCISNENVITIYLGSNSRISVNQPLFIIPDAIQFIACKKSVTNIITPLVQMPLNLHQPSLKFDQDIYQITPCDVAVINVIGSTFSAQRNLKLVSWNIIEANSDINLRTLIKQWNYLEIQSSYLITSEYLNNQQSIQLMIIYSNLLEIVSNSTIRILRKSESLQLLMSVPNRVYIMDTTQIQFVTTLKFCGLMASYQMIPVNVSITNSSTTILQNFTLQSDRQEAITFQPFQLSALSTYYIRATAQYMNQNIEVYQKFSVILADVHVTILGGDQIIGIHQLMKLEAVVLNPNILILVNDRKQYKATWKCLDLITSLECTKFSYNQFNANLSTSNYQPFTTLLIIIQVFEQKQQQQVAQNNVTVKIQENEVNQIQITGNQYQLSQPLNVYDDVDVTITYQEQINIDVDNLSYYASYLDSSYYQYNHVQFYNPQTSIIMQNFNRVKDAKFKVMVYNPVQRGPSVATLNIRLNVPPQQCKMSIFPRSSKFQVQIHSRISQSYPLQYQFVYYDTQDEFIQDSINGLIINGIKLSDFQIQSSLITYLYGQNTSLIVGFIKDSANGVSNTSFSLKNYQNTINSDMLYNMLQDTSLNLPRNTMFILKYTQLNNLIFIDKYYNQILDFSNSFNQTDKITQYIQQQLAYQQSLSNGQISIQMSTISSYINNIQQQLTFLQDQQSSNLYNKNYQFQLITLQNELSDSTTKISFLYAQSQLLENRRVLDATIKNITSMITETISNVTDILGQFSKVNQNPKTISTPQINLNAQKFSTSNINQNFKLQVVNQSNQTVSYKKQQFQVNPYQNESDFKNTVKAPLIVPNLTGQNNVQITPANPIPFNFPPVSDTDISCASKVGGSWSLDLCQIVKSSTTIQCLCQTLSPLSIAQAFQFILEQFDLLFRDKIKDSLSRFPYAQALFTYIIVVFVTLYFVLMVVLYRKDHFDRTRVYPNDILQQQPNSLDKIPAAIENGGINSLNVITDNDLIKSEERPYTKTSLIGQINDHHISQREGFKIFLQNSHVILELYHRYDDQEPRILRASILFLQIVGQICIFVLFGKNLAISIVIALSILQTVYGVVFQLILSQMIKSKNKILHYMGMIIAGLLTGFCTYLIIAAMSLFSSAYFSNIAALSYMASFCADYFVSNILIELGKYAFVLKTYDEKKYYKIYDKVLPKGLQVIVFGHILFPQEAKTQVQIPE